MGREVRWKHFQKTFGKLIGRGSTNAADQSDKYVEGKVLMVEKIIKIKFLYIFF